MDAPAVVPLDRDGRPSDAAPGGGSRWGAIGVLRALAVIAMLATLLGRALGAALRGSAAGIDRLIRWVDVAGAGLSQLFAFVGTAAAVSLLLFTLRAGRVSILHRLLAVPAGAGATTLVMMSAAHPLDFQASVLVGLASGVVALVATTVAVRGAATRGLGLLLAAAGAAGLVWLAARVVALRASSEALPALFVGARGIATAGLVLDFTATLLAAGWILGFRRGASAAVLALAAGAATWSSAGAAEFGASLPRVLLARSLSELTRGPDPLLLPEITMFVAAFSLAVAAAGLASRRPLAPAATLILLARSASDVPLGALCLTLAALAATSAAGPARGSPRGRGAAETDPGISGH